MRPIPFPTSFIVTQSLNPLVNVETNKYLFILHSALTSPQQTVKERKYISTTIHLSHVEQDSRKLALLVPLSGLSKGLVKEFGGWMNWKEMVQVC